MQFMTICSVLYLTDKTKDFFNTEVPQPNMILLSSVIIYLNHINHPSSSHFSFYVGKQQPSACIDASTILSFTTQNKQGRSDYYEKEFMEISLYHFGIVFLSCPFSFPVRSPHQEEEAAVLR